MERTIVKIEDIVLSNGRRRPVSKRKVEALATSIQDHGLLHPIVVYRLSNGGFGLSAGAHRLKACKKIGLAEIRAVIVDRPQAKIIASSENLHRNDLSILQRSLEIVHYAAATREENSGFEKRGGRQPNDKRISDLARKTGFDRKIVAEAFAHAKLSCKVRSLIRRRGFANKRSLLNELASLDSDQDQIALIDKVARRRKVGTNIKRTKPKAKKSTSALKNLMAKWKQSGMARLFSKQMLNVQKRFIKSIRPSY